MARALRGSIGEIEIGGPMERGVAPAREAFMADLVTCIGEVAMRPSQSAERLLAEACKSVGAVEGRLLLLSAETGTLEVVASAAAAGHRQPDRTPDRVPVNAADYPTEPRLAETDDGTLAVVPAVQDGTVVGALEIVAGSIDEDGIALLVTIASLLPLVRSNRVFTAGLQLVPPLPDVSGDETQFRRQVFEYLDSHTEAALVAVYLVDADLDISLVFGPPSVRKLAPFLTDRVTHERLREIALEPGSCSPYVLTEPSGESGARIASYALLSCTGAPDVDDAGGQVVESYVMLLGFPTPHRPCDAEVAVFKQLLALAGYLHQVYGYLHKVAGRVGAVAEIGSAITGLEISQKARHDAKNQIDLAQNLIAQALGRAGALRGELEDLGVILGRVGQYLEEMKRATKVPDKELVPTSIRSIWEAACGQVQWRMRERRIQVRYDGTDAMVLAAPDWFRQVFLNLLLNSADAFDMLRQRSGRITLKVHSASAKADRVEMTYADDATGVLPQHFLGCDVAGDLELRERIFMPGVTSKSGGSGWGLHVCRSIIKYHHGSIDLEPTRSGAVFRITIPGAA